MQIICRAVVLLFLATSCPAQDAARMDEVVQTYVRDNTFMGAVLVARGSDVVLSKIRIGEPRVEHSQHAGDEVPAWLDHQAVHRRVDPAARGTRQAETR
jgi:hypothetical protein